jgi:hypothetical protein
VGAKHQIRHSTIKRGIDAYSVATGVPRNTVRVELDIQKGVVSFFAANPANGTEPNPFEAEADRLRNQG